MKKKQKKRIETQIIEYQYHNSIYFIKMLQRYDRHLRFIQRLSPKSASVLYLNENHTLRFYSFGNECTAVCCKIVGWDVCSFATFKSTEISYHPFRVESVWMVKIVLRPLFEGQMP